MVWAVEQTTTSCTVIQCRNHEVTAALSPSTRVVLVATVSAKSAAPSWRLRNKEKSKPLSILQQSFSIERDAQLLANRIALLKQEEMRTWKKIEETKKRANEVVTLKHKNEMKIQQKMESLRVN